MLKNLKVGDLVMVNGELRFKAFTQDSIMDQLYVANEVGLVVGKTETPGYYYILWQNMGEDFYGSSCLKKVA